MVGGDRRIKKGDFIYISVPASENPTTPAHSDWKIDLLVKQGDRCTEDEWALQY